MAVACSYRLDLARTHTVAGIDGLAPWWTYVLRNVDSLDEGKGLASGTLYAPGQSVTSWLVLRVLDGRNDPAVLRVVFALLDGVAVVFVVLAGRELLSWAAGLVGGLLYALWPAGAAASVNLLHDHSPQPFFALAGLWLVLRALRERRVSLLWAGAVLLGLPALFRADGAVVGAGLAAGVGLTAAVTSERARRAISWALVAFFGALAPSLPYDAWILARTGRVQHIAMGDAGAAAFMRLGRASGLAGARWNDAEVAFLGGSSEPFGPDWSDARRQSILGDFGGTLFWADPGRYLGVVLRELPGTLSECAARAAWWADDARSGETPRGVSSSARLEARVARLRAVKLAQRLTDPPWIFLAGALGLVAGLVAGRSVSLVPGCVAFAWMASLVLLLPNARYLLMPTCFLFPLAGLLAGLPLAALRGRLSRPGVRGADRG